MQKQLGRNTVVLLGIGHTNAHVLRMWKMQPIENAQLVMEFVTLDIFLFLVVYVLFIRSGQLLLRSGDESLIN